MSQELLAVNAEVTYQLLAAFVQANSKTGKKLKPLRIPRPGERVEAAEQNMTHEALAAEFHRR